MNPARPRSATSTQHSQRFGCLLAVCVWLLLSGPANAAEPFATQSRAAVPSSEGLSIRFDKSYALGVNHYHLDHETKVTGWRMGERWFLGRQRGLDSGLTLVWQQQANQVSVSKDGVRFTRRF